MLTACIAAYYVLVMRLNAAVYVTLSAQLLLVVFGLAYDYKCSQLSRNSLLHYSESYAVHTYVRNTYAKQHYLSRYLAVINLEKFLRIFSGVYDKVR